jgi:hypothetical protein
MTYRAKKGETFPFNASIDRINPGQIGGEYKKENIQLVCTAINSFFKHYPRELVVEICVAVAKKNGLN